MKDELPKKRTTGNYINNLQSSNESGSHRCDLIDREKDAGVYFR